MAHHSSDDPFQSKAMEELLKVVSDDTLRKQLESAVAFGPTDRYPEGKYSPNDEGEIRFGIARDGDKVLVDFGAPVHSLGMTREQARDFGRMLITKAGFTCRIGFDGD